MSASRGFNRGWIFSAVAVCALAAGFLALRLSSPPAKSTEPRSPTTAPTATADTAPLDVNTPLASLPSALARGDGMALAILQKRAVPETGAAPAPIAAAEAEAWLSALTSLRNGFPQYAPYGRASAVAVAASILEKFAAEPSPAEWSAALSPVFDIMSASLADNDSIVRLAALQRVAGLWRLSPARDLHTVEVERLATWKESLYNIATRSMGAADTNVRAAAVAAIASLPLDDKAQPALAYLKDPSAQVRIQVLGGFARRAEVLDSEAILPLLYDPDATIASYAAQVLKDRGLTTQQIDLGRHVVHPLPRMRAAAVALILSHSDIDPTLWLVFLSRDSDAIVRAKAVEALASSKAPEAIARLAEMATSDPAPEIRREAAKASSEPEATAALPALPAASRLNPKAN